MGGKLREMVNFMRVGTLDNPDQMPPDVHIYTCSKQPWVVLPEGAHAVDIFYDTQKTWSPESLERLSVLKAAVGISDS